VGITSTKAGKSSATYGSFKHILNGTLEKFRYSTDYPTGATVDRDINDNEKIENPIRDTRQRFPQDAQRDNVDKLNETVTFADMTTTAFGGGNPGFNGPWDFDVTDEGFRSGLYTGSKGNVAEITNWGEDHDYDGTLNGPSICINNAGIQCSCSGGIYPCGSGTPRTGQSSCASDARCLTIEDFDGDQDGTLDQGWSLNGGCGFLSSANIATGGGIWHTGQIGPRGATTCSSTVFPQNPASGPPACELIDVEPGTSSTYLWWEFLRTPTINKVHVNPDNRSIDYRVEITDWRWNMNADYQPDLVAFTWELDENTASIDPVDLGDGTVLGLHDDGLGPLNGANVNLTRGYPMFNDTDQDDDVSTFGQLAVFGCFAAPATPCSCSAGVVSCAAAACGGAPNNCGVVSNGRQGRNRAADRSCLFESLPAANVNLPTRCSGSLAVDDDCDNDIVSLGLDGAPGVAGVDDDGDGVVGQPRRGLPVLLGSGLDRRRRRYARDEGDERQRFYRCSANTSVRCAVTASTPTTAPSATEPAGASATASRCPTATTSAATARSTRVCRPDGRPRPCWERTVTASRRTRTGPSMPSTAPSCASKRSRTGTTRRPAISSRPRSGSSSSKERPAAFRRPPTASASTT
jgi:hypothetical protein